MIRELTKSDIELLHTLAEQVAEIAENKIWAEKIALWKRFNKLEKTRPMVMFPPECWNEIIPEASLQIQDPLFQSIEYDLKQRIYRAEHFHDDIVITKNVFIPYCTHITDWMEGRKRPYANMTDHSQAGSFHPCVIEMSDLKKLKMPKLTVDYEQSKYDYELACEVFGKTLNVVKGLPFNSNSHGPVKGWGTSMIDMWCELRGLEQVFFDMADEPEFTHDAMEFMTQAMENYLNKGMELGIWTLNNNEYINAAVTPCGSNGMAFTDELPAEDYNGKVRLKDLWGYEMAQELTIVSPEMLEEYILPYQRRIASLFAINAYGCCENNDRKWELLKQYIPNLRELSVSAFSDLGIAVEHLRDEYILSWKANPTNVLVVFDPDKIRRDMTEVMETAKGTHLIVGLREAWTCQHKPERGGAWVDICMELAEKYS